MTTMAPLAPPGPSPAGINPFARPRPALPTSNSFSRATLLPTIPSPAKAAQPNGAVRNGLAEEQHMKTPAEKGMNGNAVASSSKAVMESGGKRQAWRLLWRGGLEIGKDGWRLEGVTFFALLSFPSTPSVQMANPFDATPVQPVGTIGAPTGGGSPFALPSADTDLCLSLESMRGRKYLRIRGVVDLKDDEVLEASEDGGVQMSIAHSSPLLVAYFTGLLCRSETLSSQGRTLSAVVIGLGDEGVGDSTNSTILVYGQLHTPDVGTSTSAILRLCVGRRRTPPPPPTAKKVRPGEPLPRPPMFLPSKSSKPRPLSKSRSFSRSTSVASIYAPPPQLNRIPEVERLPAAPISGRTPGRRGEKRPRPNAEEEERRRKNGRIVPTSLPTADEGDGEDLQVKEEPPPDEDIFGKRPPPKPVLELGSDEPSSTGRAKRIRVPQQVLDNKAAIRKQTLLLLEARQISRDHTMFKDVFGMVTKGVYFAFRNRLAENALEKSEIQDFVARHLDMYL